MIIITAKKKKIDLEEEANIIAKIKKAMKKDPVAKEICKEHGFDIDIIDGISISFVDDLEASAKTVDAKISLNSNLLDEEFHIIMRYAIHEFVHSLQHMKSEGGKDEYKGKDYLDRGDEMEAFQYQIKYDAKQRGLGAAKKYTEELLEYHDIPERKSKVKKKELLNKAL
jgi:hypothetical protein